MYQFADKYRHVFKAFFLFSGKVCALLLLTVLLGACATTSENIPDRGGYPTAGKASRSGAVSAPSRQAPASGGGLPSVYMPPDQATPVPVDPYISPPEPPARTSAPAPVPAGKARPASPPQPTAASRVAAGLATPVTLPSGGQVQACWLPLVERLQKDPNADSEVVGYFASLPAYSPLPMGTKVKELFTSAFMRKPSAKPSGPPSRIYRNVVTQANVQKCRDFLAQYREAFKAVEKKYPVPKEILVSLLYVETRLGTYVGKENAFWSLACMAAATQPEHVKGGLEGIPITEQHNAWLQAKLTDKSEWAYKEMRALLKYCYVQQLDPHSMPGSVYGAIGVCQFMPSNLVPYGDDGDNDGVVNLFSEPDAIFSAALYLTKHGWKNGLGVAQQRAVLKRYNNLNIYANTILALAESIRTGVLQTGPPDSVQAKAPKQAKAAKKKKK